MWECAEWGRRSLLHPCNGGAGAHRCLPRLKGGGAWGREEVERGGATTTVGHVQESLGFPSPTTALPHPQPTGEEEEEEERQEASTQTPAAALHFQG